MYCSVHDISDQTSPELFKHWQSCEICVIRLELEIALMKEFL